MDAYQEIIEQLRKTQNTAKPKYEYFMVHIDDLLMISRQFRKQGIVLKRQYDVYDNKNNRFAIVSGSMTLGTIIVDIHRFMERGSLYGFNKHSF